MTTDTKNDRAAHANRKASAESDLRPFALAPAMTARTAARNRLQAAQAALDRAEEVASESQAEADRHAGAKRAADQAHADAVKAWILAGSIGPRPAPVVDQQLVDAEAAARAEHQASTGALASLRASQERARADLAEAEERVRQVVTDILIAEAKSIAAEIVGLEERAVELRLTLAGIIDTALVRKRHERSGVPREISIGLYQPKPTPDSAFFSTRYFPELLSQNQVGCERGRQRAHDCVAELLGESSERPGVATDPKADTKRRIAEAVAAGARL